MIDGLGDLGEFDVEWTNETPGPVITGKTGETQRKQTKVLFIEDRAKNRETDDGVLKETPNKRKRKRIYYYKTTQDQNQEKKKKVKRQKGFTKIHGGIEIYTRITTV